MDFTLFIFVILLEYAHSQSQPNPVPSPGCGQPTPESGTFTIGHGGYTRTYIVHQPTNYDINTPIPFVFNFHGYTGTAQGFRNFWYGDANANDMNYLNVYVESTNGANRNSWNDIGCSSSPGPAGPTCNYGTVSDVPIPSICPRDQGPGLNDGYCNWCNCEANDIDFIDYLGGIIEQNYCIDISREYALGYSQGGMMAHTVGCQLNGRFAAIAPC